MTDPALVAALPFAAWSRIWSPLVSEPLRAEAWSALELPGAYEEHATVLWSTFQVGMPLPLVPLLLHAALGLEGASAREDWLRVIHHLHLTWNEQRLPPDHLGIACEVFACAIEACEPVLVRELRQRYLRPWCEVAIERLGAREHPLVFLPERLRDDLIAAPDLGP